MYKLEGTELTPNDSENALRYCIKASNISMEKYVENFKALIDTRNYWNERYGPPLEAPIVNSLFLDFLSDPLYESFRNSVKLKQWLPKLCMR